MWHPEIYLFVVFSISILQIINVGLDLLEAGKYKAMIIGHQGQNFCAGANLAGILQFCENGDWDGLEQTVKIFQDLTQKITKNRCLQKQKGETEVSPFSIC